LTDTGPLVALIDRSEQAHKDCVRALADIRGPMLSTWPVLTEAMYLLGDAGGLRGQRGLWEMVARNVLQLIDMDGTLVGRMRQLMEKYADVPMSLADASLVAVADRRGIRRVFTLDSDFSIYRTRRRGIFELVP